MPHLLHSPPLSRIPQHFSSSNDHNYERLKYIEVPEAWKALYGSNYPIKLNTEARLQAWAPPLQPAALIPHPTQVLRYGMPPILNLNLFRCSV
jgi:hypothetical protein